MEILKPSSINTIWADQGAKIKPEDSKILLGWVAEIPPYQVFNWAENRRDVAIAHINQHGIAEWDAITQYLANKSYVQGGDGKIYKAIINSQNKNPTTEHNYWKEAFISTDSGEASKEFVGYSVQSSNFMAIANTRYYVTNASVVTLPTTATTGDTVTLNKAPIVTPRIVVTTGTINTPVGQDSTILFDVNDEINFVFNGTTWEII